MPFLLAGIAILCGLLLLGYAFVKADPARMAHNIRWAGIAIAVLLGLGLLVLTRGRVAIFMAPLLPLIPALRRMRARFRAAAGPPPSQSSSAETAFLRMGLDHDTGRMSGTVLQGRFAGMRLEEMGRADLLALLRECRAADEEGARLLEAYLDRIDPDWREAMHGESGSTPDGRAPDMTTEEAYAVLGLQPGADSAAIRAAHHRLMKQLHPDHGGTDYLASQINRARDVLLHG